MKRIQVIESTNPMFKIIVARRLQVNLALAQNRDELDGDLGGNTSKLWVYGVK